MAAKEYGNDDEDDEEVDDDEDEVEEEGVSSTKGRSVKPKPGRSKATTR